MDAKTSLSKIKSSMFKRNEDLIRITSYVILATTLIVFILNRTVPYDSWRFSVSILLMSAILIINLFWNQIDEKFSSKTTSDLFFTISSAILTLFIAWIGKFYNIIFLIFMITAQAYMMLKPKVATLVIGLFTGLYLVTMSSIGFNWEDLVNLGFSLLVGMVFVITLSLVLTRYAEQTARAENLAQQLQTANQELITARQREKELVIAEERVRLAREIHDGIGHHLTALNIQLQAAEKIMEKRPERAIEALQVSRKEAKAALEEIRRSVAVMRRSPLDGKTLQEALAGLVNDFSETSEKEIRFTVTGDSSDLNPQIATTVFRAAQEGLTNIHKHASNARQIEIHLAFAPDQISLTIADDGSTANEDHISSGFGLAGIQERAEQLGGKMNWQKTEPQGSTLHIEIPLRGESDD